MRLSAEEGDVGYRDWLMTTANGKIVLVFLDGEEVLGAVTADDQLGFVKRHVLDRDGMTQSDPHDPDRIWTEEVTGHVEIRLVDELIT